MSDEKQNPARLLTPEELSMCNAQALVGEFWRKDADQQPDVPQAAAAEIARLREQLADAKRERDALREDAERYRWLRTQCDLRDRGYGDSGRWTEFPELHWSEGASSANAAIDAAIDAARKEQQ
jgi:hypothetical protein